LSCLAGCFSPVLDCFFCSNNVSTFVLSGEFDLFKLIKEALFPGIYCLLLSVTGLSFALAGESDLFKTESLSPFADCFFRSETGSFLILTGEEA